MEIGRWVHIGDKNTIRCHEGSLRFGDKVVLGRDNVINTYLDIEIGDSVLMADWCLRLRLRPQDGQRRDADQGPGHRQGPVRIGPDTWVAAKVTVLREGRVSGGAACSAPTRW